jgi:hypothetical protein
VKINEGPARPAHGEPEAFHDHTAEGVPPLTATTSGQPENSSEAPKWPAAAATAPPPVTSQPMPTTLQPAPTTAGNSGLPDMPAIPALPNVSTASQSAQPATANAVPVTLPANIPQARYPDAGESDSSTLNAVSSLPVQGSQTIVAGADTTVIGSVPVAGSLATAPTTDHEHSVATNNAMAAIGLTPQPLSTNPPPPTDPNAAPAMQIAPGADRYGFGAANAADRPLTESGPPIEPTFAAAWPKVQAALDRGARTNFSRNGTTTIR